MRTKNETDALRESILLLENQQRLDLILLKSQVHETFESLRPINLIKSTISEVSASSDLKHGLLQNGIGLVTGYLSRKVLLGSSHNPVVGFLGSLFQFAIGNVVAKHSDTVIEKGENLLRKFSSHKN